MKDPIEELGNEHLYLLATDLQVQLEKGTAMRPVLYLLTQQRRKAREAISKLVEVDPTETTAISALQAEIRLYSDLIETCQELVVRGKEADSLINEDERRDMEDIIRAMPPEQQRLHGFSQQGGDDR